MSQNRSTINSMNNHLIKGNQKGKVTCYARERVNKNELF